MARVERDQPADDRIVAERVGEDGADPRGVAEDGAADLDVSCRHAGKNTREAGSLHGWWVGRRTYPRSGFLAWVVGGAADVPAKRVPCLGGGPVRASTGRRRRRAPDR